MNSFDPLAINPVSGTPGVVTFAGVNGTPVRAFATDWNNLGPRVGFAYQLTASGRTVLRGGTGIFYGPTVSNTIGDTAALGFSTAASFVVSQATTQSAFRLRDGFPAYARPAADTRLRRGARGDTPEHRRSRTSIRTRWRRPHTRRTSTSSTSSSSGLVVEVGYIVQREPPSHRQRLLAQPGACRELWARATRRRGGRSRSSAT